LSFLFGLVAGGLLGAYWTRPGGWLGYLHGHHAYYPYYAPYYMPTYYVPQPGYYAYYPRAHYYQPYYYPAYYLPW